MTNRIDRNPLTGEITVVTPNRLERPNALLDGERTQLCPFCPGNEDETPPEIERVASADGGWLIRVVPNKYPIASPDVDLAGVHEVVIESPHHEDELRTMTANHVTTLIDVWLRRMDHASTVEGVQTVLLFRNRGPHAGESIRHPHTQLLAIPFVPDRIERQRNPREGCNLCRGESDLTIASNDSYRLQAAPAARLAHQCWIVPHSHSNEPSRSDSEPNRLASMMQLAESILYDELGDHSMNWSLIQAPVGETRFHWYMELSPRLTGIAGLELATGAFVNLVPPEESAARLRRRLNG